MSAASEETREILLAGLRHALQMRVATIWNNVTLEGAQEPGPRFKKGVTAAVDYYKQAVVAVEKMKI
jgi:hypothetical protein